MKTFCVAYDLNSPVRDYSRLIEAIKLYGTWWHHLDSTWFIKSDSTATQIRDHLGQYIDSDDELLVFEVGLGWAGKGFRSNAYDWLKKNW